MTELPQLCSVVDAKAYIGVDGDASDDAFILQCVKDASAYIQGASACNRLFAAPADTTRYFDAIRDTCEGYRVLTLDDDLCAITTVLNGDGTTIAASSYTTSPRNFTPYYEIKLKINSGYVWTYNTNPEDAIAITGRWAYSVTPSDEVRRWCIRLAKWYYRQRDQANDIQSPIVTGNGVVIMPAASPRDVTEGMKGYRRVHL